MTSLLLVIGLAGFISKSPQPSYASVVVCGVLLLAGMLFPAVGMIRSLRGAEYQYPLHVWSYPFYGKLFGLHIAPRELWIILAAYVLENAAYKLSSGPVLPLWLSHQLGMADTTKGLTIGIWSALMTFFTVLVGSFTDAAGIRRTFLLGFAICIFARVAMMFSSPAIVPLGLGLLPLALGLALMSPVMTAAMKRYSNAAQRSMAFSLYYALMNLGFAIGDRLFDHFRHVMGEYGSWTLPWLKVDLSTYRVMILWSVGLTIPGMLLTWFFMRDRVEMTEEGVRIAPAPKAARNPIQLASVLGQIRAKVRQTLSAVGKACRRRLFWQLLLLAGVVASAQFAICLLTHYWFPGFEIVSFVLSSFLATLTSLCSPVLILMALGLIFREVVAATSATGAKSVELFDGLWPQPSFRRFLFFMLLVVGVKMIFYHFNYTLPDFAIRELGKGAPFAQVCNMLNSLLILGLVPICGALTGRVTAYRMVTVGSFVSALSVFFLVVPSVWFKPLADGWLGELVVHQWLQVPGPVNPVYIALFLFTVMLSFGEAFWSPRLYEYAAAIAPKGQEASYMALSVLPYFFAKFGAGSLSGWLLATYCPADGPRNTAMMWLWVGGMALITPVGTFIFRKYIQVHEEGR